MSLVTLPLRIPFQDSWFGTRGGTAHHLSLGAELVRAIAPGAGGDVRISAGSWTYPYTATIVTETSRLTTVADLYRQLGISAASPADVVLLEIDRSGATPHLRFGRHVESAAVDGERARRVAIAESTKESIDTHSAAGRLVLNVLASVSQWEREAIGERTAAALSVKSGRGERVGSVPFGYTLASDGVHLVAHDDEQATVRAARELRAAGLSLRGVAQRLATLGHRSRTGRSFAAMQVARMLDAPEASAA